MNDREREEHEQYLEYLQWKEYEQASEYAEITIDRMAYALYMLGLYEV